MSKLTKLKVVLRNADPIKSDHFIYLVREASKDLSLDEKWYMNTLKVAPSQLRKWKMGMCPSLQERLLAYKAFNDELAKQEDDNTQGEGA